MMPREWRRFLVALAGALLFVGAGVGYCAAPSTARVAKLKGIIAEQDQRLVFSELAVRTYKRAAAKADSALARADARATTSAATYTAARGRVTIDGPFVLAAPDGTTTTPPDTLATDPRVASALAAADTALADARVALDSAFLALDAKDAVIAQQDTMITLLRARVASGDALRVAIERVNRRPRFGFKAGAAVGALAVVGLLVVGSAP
jgi:hypothetical protein